MAGVLEAEAVGRLDMHCTSRRQTERERRGGGVRKKFNMFLNAPLLAAIWVTLPIAELTCALSLLAIGLAGPSLSIYP